MPHPSSPPGGGYEEASPQAEKAVAAAGSRTTTAEQASTSTATGADDERTSAAGSPPPPATQQRLPPSPSVLDEGRRAAEGPYSEVEDEQGEHGGDASATEGGLHSELRPPLHDDDEAGVATKEGMTVSARAGSSTAADASADPDAVADEAAADEPTTSTEGPPPTQQSPFDAEGARGAGGQPGEGEVVEVERERSSPNVTASEADKVAATDVDDAAVPPALPPPVEYEVSIPVTEEGLLLELSEVPTRIAGNEQSAPTPVHAVGACFAGYKRFSDGRVGPAEEAGLVRSRGDRIMAVEGVSVVGVSFWDVVDTTGRAVRRLRSGGSTSCRIRFVEAAEWERWSAEASRCSALRDNPQPSPEGGGEVKAKTPAGPNSTTADNRTLSQHKTPPPSPPALGEATTVGEARKSAEAGEYESAIPVTKEGLLIKLEECRRGVVGDDDEAGDDGDDLVGRSGGDEEKHRAKEGGDNKFSAKGKVPYEGRGSGKGVEEAVMEDGGGDDMDDGEDMNRKDSVRDDTGVEKCRCDDDGDAKDGVECKVVDGKDGIGKGDDHRIAFEERGSSDRDDGKGGEELTCQEMDKCGEKCGGEDDGSIARNDVSQRNEVGESGQGGKKLSSGEDGDNSGDSDGEERRCQSMEKDNDGDVNVGSESSQEKDSDGAKCPPSHSNSSEQSRKSSPAVTASACFAGYKRFSDGRIGPAQTGQLVKSLGDRIVAVENVSVLGLSFDDVVDRIRAAIQLIEGTKTSSKTPLHGGVCRIRFVEAAKWDGWSLEASRWTALWESSPPPSEGCGRLSEAAHVTEATERFPTRQRQNSVHPVSTLGTGNASGWPAQHPPSTAPQPQMRPYDCWPQHHQHQRLIPFGHYFPVQNYWFPVMPQRYLDPICSLCCKPIQYGIPQVHFPPCVAEGRSPVHLHMTCGKVAYVRGRPDLNLVHPYATVRKIEREWRDFFGFLAVNAADKLRALVPKVRASLPEWHGYRTADPYCLEGELRAVTEELYVDLKKKYGAPRRKKTEAMQSKKRESAEEDEGSDVTAEKVKESTDEGKTQEVRAQDTRRDDGDSSSQTSKCTPGVANAPDDAEQCNDIDDKTKLKDRVENKTGEHVEEAPERNGIATRADDANETRKIADGGGTKNASLGVYFTILHGANASKSVNRGATVASTCPASTREAGREMHCAIKNKSGTSSDTDNDEGWKQQNSRTESEKDEEKEIEEEAMFVLAAIEESRRSEENTFSKGRSSSSVESFPDMHEQIYGKKKQPNKKLKESSASKDSRKNTVGKSPNKQEKRIGKKKHTTKTSTVQIIVIDDSDFDSYVPTSDDDDDDDYVPPRRKRVRTSSTSSGAKHRRRQLAKKVPKVDRPCTEKRRAKTAKKVAKGDCPDGDQRAKDKVKKMAKVELPKRDKKPRKKAEPKKLPKCVVRGYEETGGSASQRSSALVGSDESQPVSTDATRPRTQSPYHTATVSWQPVPSDRSFHSHGLSPGSFPPWPEWYNPPYQTPHHHPSAGSYYGRNPGSGGRHYWHPPPHSQPAQFDTAQSPPPSQCFQQAPYRWR